MTDAVLSLLDLAPVPMVMTTVADGRVVYVNRRAEELWGFRSQDVVGKPGGWWWVHEEDGRRYLECMDAQGAVRDLDVLFRRRDGSTFWGYVSTTVVSHGGRPVHLSAVNDISPLKRVEAQLRESERRFRALAENTDDVIWTLDLRTGRFSYVSPSILKLRGLTPEQAVNEPVEHSLTPESLVRVQALLAKVGSPAEQASHAGIFDQPCADGTIKHVEITTRFIRDATGAAVEVVGVSRDATRRVEEDAARSQLVEELQHALAEVKRLSGLIPICAYCKKVRDDAGFWSAVEAYVSQRSDALFSHGICPSCADRHFPGMR